MTVMYRCLKVPGMDVNDTVPVPVGLDVEIRIIPGTTLWVHELDKQVHKKPLAESVYVLPETHAPTGAPDPFDADVLASWA
jgi:hypothetical protein